MLNKVLITSTIVGLVGASSLIRGQEATPAVPDAQQVVRDIAAKVAGVTSFSATVETGEQAEGDSPVSATSSLLVSKDHGWKMLAKEGSAAFQLVTDYNELYQYFPDDRRVMKTTADKPEIKAMLRKTATDMNPIQFLNPQSIKFHGKQDFEGEPVYKVTGTTESQMMPGGPLVTRNVTALVSVNDGLPRKTEESIGVSTGTTVYHNVKVNVPVTAEDFKFKVPEGVSVIDTNEQMRRLESSGAGLDSQTSAPKP